MTANTAMDKRLLGVAITSRGYGFVLMEGPHSLVDWGGTQPRPYREVRCLEQLRRTIEQYGPDLLVVEDAAARARSCSARVRSLHEAIRALAQSLGVPMRALPWRRVRMAFHPTGHMTKYGIARAVGRHLPALGRRMPRYRKPWMSEDYRMVIFEAAALVLAAYHSLPRYRNFLHKQSNA